MKNSSIFKLNYLYIATIILMLADGVWADIYQKAQERLRNSNIPTFVEEQIDIHSKPPEIQEPEMAAIPEAEQLLPQDILLQGYEEEHRQPLEQLAYAVEPLLATEQGQQFQTQAQRGRLDSIVARRVELTPVLNIIFARNPQIKAASEAWQQALTRYPQSAFLEGILRQYNAFTKRQNLMLGMNQGVEAEFPFPGLTALRGNLVQTDIRLAQLEYVIMVREMMAEAKKMFHEYVFLQKAIRVTMENQRLLEQMLDVASTQFEAGNASYNDVIKARVEYSRLTDNLITLEEQKETIAARLNSMMDRPPQAQLGEGIELKIEVPAETLEQLYAHARRNRQEIKQLEVQIQRTQIMIDMARQMNRPEPTLGASYFQDRSTGRAGVGRMESFTPAPRMRTRPEFAQQEAYIVEMISQREKLKREQENTINQTLLDVKNAHFAMDTARRETELYRTTLLPEAEQSLLVAEADYLGAQINFLDYLDAQRTLLELNMEFYMAQYNLRTSITELERSVGGHRQQLNF